MTRLFLCLLSLCSISACGGTASPHDALWKRYTQSLARTLEREAPARPEQMLPQLPSGADLRFVIRNAHINVLEFMRLRRCKLGQTIAEKNSILGRHGDAAAALVFSLRFLDEVDACIDGLDDVSLISSLEDARAKHRENLAKLLFNALIAGPEFREAWHAPAQTRQAYPPQQHDVAATALRHWLTLQERWLQGKELHRYPEIVPLLETLRRGLGGEWLHFQREAIQGLETANAIISQRVDGRPLCLNGQANHRATVFASVLERVFIEGIQTQASAANRHQQALLEALNAVTSSFSGQLQLPDGYREWQQQLLTLRERLLQAHRRHVALSSALLQQCGLHTAT